MELSQDISFHIVLSIQQHYSLNSLSFPSPFTFLTHRSIPWIILDSGYNVALSSSSLLFSLQVNIATATSSSLIQLLYNNITENIVLSYLICSTRSKNRINRYKLRPNSEQPTFTGKRSITDKMRRSNESETLRRRSKGSKSFR